MEIVAAYEAKIHLTKLLERVSKGERITISKHGVPIAVLQPYDTWKIVDLTAVIAEIHQFREGNSLEGFSIRDMLEEARR